MRHLLQVAASRVLRAQIRVLELGRVEAILMLLGFRVEHPFGLRLVQVVLAHGVALLHQLRVHSVLATARSILIPVAIGALHALRVLLEAHRVLLRVVCGVDEDVAARYGSSRGRPTNRIQAVHGESAVGVR